MEIQRKNEFTWPAHMLTCSPHVFLHVLMLKGIGLLTVTWPCKNQEGWPVWCPCWNVDFFSGYKRAQGNQLWKATDKN